MYVKVFLKLLNLSLLDLEQDNDGARDICETQQNAHPKLYKQGNKQWKKNLILKE